MRQTSYKGLLLLAALLLGSLPLLAQQNQDSQPASVNIFTGLVRSAAGIPIPGATVKITSIETKKSWIS